MKFGQVDDLDAVDFSLPTLDKITKTNLSSLRKGNNFKFYFLRNGKNFAWPYVSISPI